MCTCTPSKTHTCTCTHTTHSQVHTKFVVGFQSTFLCLQPWLVSAGHLEAVVNRVKAEDFEVVTQDERRWTPQQAAEFFESRSHEKIFPHLVDMYSCGPCVLLALRKKDAVSELLAVCGAVGANADARTLRVLYGKDSFADGVYCSASLEAAERDLALVFKTFVVGDQETFVLVRPD